MHQPLPILTDDEVSHSVPAGEEAGFGALSTAKGPLPLKAMDVRARLDGLLSQVVLRQTFVNTLGEPLEATYVFPLPDRAAVTRFRMEVAGRVIEGVLKERGAARRDYQEAIQAGHRAAITEEERPGVFTLRVGNLMPGEEATVHLTLTGPLPYSDGEATFRFPLVVAPRYIPGAPLPGDAVGSGTALDTDAVPDASRITPPVLLPGYPSPVRLTMTVDVYPSGLPLGTIRSSLHAFQEEEVGGVRHLTFGVNERLNRDLILRLRFGADALQTSLAVQPDAAGDAGTFVLTLVPPAEAGRVQRPRDVVFVLDRSGSMGGWKMVAARRALARMVETLTEQDRFTVYAFDDRIETPPAFGGQGLVPAGNRQRFQAGEFLAKVEARGGTEMAQPLSKAVDQFAGQDKERDRILVLVTDGQIGNEDQILRNLGKRVQHLRIFALGIDRAVNEGFLKRLAGLGGGACEVVESEDRLDAVMDQVHRQIGTPVVTGLRLEPAGLAYDPQSVVPTRLPDLFPGAPLFILGRYRGTPGGLALQGRTAAGEMWLDKVPAQHCDNPGVTSVWARGQVRELEDRYVIAQGDRSQLEKQIVDLSVSFGVLSRFTAYVAVDRSQVVNEGGQVVQLTQPVEAPEGWDNLTRSGPALFCCMSAPAESVDSMLMEFDASDTGSRGLTARARGPALPTWSKAQKSSPPPKTAPPGGASGLGGKLKSLLGQLLGPSVPAMGRLHEPSAPTGPKTPAANLTALRLRARELLEQLQKQAAADAVDRLEALRQLAGKLPSLIEDVKAGGAANAEWQALQKLLGDVQGLLAKKKLNESRLATVWSKAVTLLEAVAQGTGRTESFWK